MVPPLFSRFTPVAFPALGTDCLFSRALHFQPLHLASTASFPAFRTACDALPFLNSAPVTCFPAYWNRCQTWVTEGLQPGVLQPGDLTTGGVTTIKVFLQPGSLTTRGSYNQGSYSQGFLQPRVLPTRSSYNQGSYNQGCYNQVFLQPGVLQLGVFISRGLTTRGS